MEAYKKLLLANKAWIKEKISVKPDYFQRLAIEQKPEFLWIGCSDSRVPAEDITGTEPGELFVHRNIANLVVSTDFNLLSVLQFAVDHLKVKHIIVCGHHGCGGVKAALSQQRFGLMNKWLRNIKDVYRNNQAELERITDASEKTDRLVELNVREQVNNIARTSIVQKAWHFENRPTIHGCVYSLKTGLLQDLVTIDPRSPLEEIYKFDFSDGPNP